MKKLLTILTLLVCVVLQAWADERPLQLWPETSYSLTWEEYCIKDIFSNVTTGAELSFTYTSNSGSPQLQVWHKDGSYNGTQMSVTTTESSTFKVTISTDTELEDIKARGIYIKGQDATITQISYTPNGGNPTTLWPETSYAISWSERTLLTSTMSSLSTGDGLRVTFTKSADSPQMQLQHKNESWSATDLFNDNITEPSYTVILSETAVADIKARGLTMKGQNATVTKIEAVALYTLTVTSSNEEYGIVTVETTALSGSKYVSGTEVSVKAEAKAGYRFVNWTDNNNSDAAVSTDATYTFSISANTSLKANFEAESTHTDKPEVNVSAFSAMTSENNTPNFSDGTLTTTAAWTGIQQWIGDNSGVQGSQLVVKTESACKLKIDVYYTDNTQRSLTVPETAISTFVLALEKTKYIKSIQIQNSEVGIVKFTSIALDPLYTITATSADTDKGTATVETAPTSDSKYAYGTSVTVTATPESGYSFSQWKVGETSVSTDASYTFTATEDVALTAEFTVAKTTQALKNATQKMVNETVGTKVLIASSAFANVSAGDVITVNMSEVATSGASIVLKENANGHSFFGDDYRRPLTSGWTSFTHTLTASDIALLDGDNNALCITGEGFTCGNITITSAGSITADAAHTTMYVLSVAQPASGGTIQIGGSDAAAQKAYDNGSQVTLTAVPANGYIFSKWTKDGSDAGSAESLNVTFNGADITVTAEFITNPRILTGSNEYSTGNSLFSSLALGDKIRVNFSKTDENDAEYTPSIEVRLTSGDTNSKLSGNFNSSTDAEKTLYEIKVTEESAVTSIKSNGLFITGNDITIGDITVIPAKQLTWYNEYEIPASEFSTIGVGGKINLTFTRSTNPYLQIVCPTTDSWTYLDGVSLTADTYSYDVTEDNCEPIKTKGLRLKGQDLTYSSVSVEAASPSPVVTPVFDENGKADLSKVEKYGGEDTSYSYSTESGIGTITAPQWSGATLKMTDVTQQVSGTELIVTLDEAAKFGVYVYYADNTTSTEDAKADTESGTSVTVSLNKEKKIKEIIIKSHAEGSNTLKLKEILLKQEASVTKTEQTLLEKSVEIDSEGSTYVTIPKEKFENVADGDILKIYGTVSDQSQLALYYMADNWTILSEDANWSSFTTSPYSLTLTETTAGYLKSNGLAIKGKNFTFTKATLTSAGAVPTINYALTKSVSPAEKGSITVMQGETNVSETTSFAEGTTLTLTATAVEGYVFLKWMSGETELEANTDKSLTVTMDADKSITAFFEAAADTRTEQPINMTENVIGNWNNFTIKKEKFNNVASTGDVIKIYVKDVKEDAQISLKIPTGNWDEFKGFNPTTTDTEFSYTITSEVLAQLKEYGLAVSGKNYTSVKLTLKTNGTVPIENYALTYAASPEIGGTVAVTKKVGDASENIASGTTVAEFTELTATVTANEGFSFKNWQVNGQDKTNQSSTTYKFVMDKDASLLAVFNPPIFEYELTLWEDSKAITWDEWSTGNSNENFSQVKKNDMIRITFTKSDDSPQMQIWQKDADWNGTQIYGGDVEEPSYAFFVANDAMATNIMERGLYIKGQNATITKIELLTNSVVTDPRTEKTLVEKTQAIADGDIEINRGLFSNAVAGDIIRIYAKDLSATSKIALATDYDSAFDGANWTGFTESPFSLKLTASLLSKVQEKNLLIRGENFTFKKAVLYTESELGEAIGSGGEEPEISNTDASEEAKKLFNVLKDLYGEKIVSGVVANVDWNTKEAENVYNWTGKWPALNVYDFINLHASKDVNSAGWVDYSDITTAKNWWKEGGIVGAMWHWQVKANNGTDYTCTPGTAADETSFDASKVYVDGTSENTLAKQQLDQLCGYLKKMQDAGIPVVWRPLHEASGNVEQYSGGKAWFWWGAKGADVYKQLWQWMYNYMVKTKGLNNLIWVWTSQTNDNNWYPGDAYVDIIGRDNYGATAATLATEYEALKAAYPNKMITLSECGNSESTEMAKLSSIRDAGSRWSWFMTWYDGTYNDGTSTTHKHAGKTWWDDAMAKDYVVTRDQMKELLGQDSGGGSQTGVNISLDDLNEGWSSTYDTTTKTITTTGDWGARGWYIGDGRYNSKGSITVKFQAVDFPVTLKMVYINTNNEEKAVQAGAAAGETEIVLDIPTDVKTINTVHITYEKAGTLVLTAVSVNDKVPDNRTEKSLVEKTQAIADGDIEINRGLFSNAVVGDIIRIYATGLSATSKIALATDYDSAFDGANWTEFTESPFALKLTASLLSKVQEKNLLIRGENFTFKKAVLYTESELGNEIIDIKSYTLTIQTPQNGTITVKRGNEQVSGGSYDEGTVLTLTAVPNDGFQFVKWTKNGVDAGTESTLTITMDSDVDIAAFFEEIPKPVIDEETGETDLSTLTAQDETTTVTYDEETETVTMTTTEPDKGVQIWFDTPEEVKGNVLLVDIAEANVTVSVTVRYTDGTQSSMTSATAASQRTVARRAASNGTTIAVPVETGKQVQCIEVKNAEAGVIRITKMAVIEKNVFDENGKADLSLGKAQSNATYDTSTYTLATTKGWTGLTITPLETEEVKGIELMVKFASKSQVKVAVTYSDDESIEKIMEEAAPYVKMTLDGNKNVKDIMIQTTTAAIIQLTEVAVNQTVTPDELPEPVFSNGKADLSRFEVQDANKVMYNAETYRMATTDGWIGVQMNTSEAESVSGAELAVSFTEAVKVKFSVTYKDGTQADTISAQAQQETRLLLDATKSIQQIQVQPTEAGALQFVELVVRQTPTPDPEPVYLFNEQGEADLTMFQAMDDNASYDTTTYQITTSQNWAGIQAWLENPQSVSGNMMSVKLIEESANIRVTIGYTDGTESAADGSKAIATETGTEILVPNDATKEIQKIMIQVVEKGSVTLQSIRGIDYSVTELEEGETRLLWKNSQGVELHWNNICEQDAVYGALLKEDQQLCITIISRDEDNEWPKVFIRDINNQEVGEVVELNSLKQFPNVVRLTLTEEMVSRMADGFSICGDGITVNRVELYQPYAPQAGDINLKELNGGWNATYDAASHTITTTARWAARGWDIGDSRYNGYDLIQVKFLAVDFPVTLKMEYRDANGSKQATSTGVSAGNTTLQMPIPENIQQIDKVYLIWQQPASLTLTAAEVLSESDWNYPELMSVSTDIRYITHDGESDKWYDLNGRRVEQPGKGVFIKNGKKTVVSK